MFYKIIEIIKLDGAPPRQSHGCFLILLLFVGRSDFYVSKAAPSMQNISKITNLNLWK